MPIIFDTLEELKEFYRSFRLDEGTEKGTVIRSSVPERQVEVPSVRTERHNGYNAEPARSRKAEPEKRKSVKPVEAPVAIRRDRSNTLTARIQNAIRKCLDEDMSFTANDIYQDLADQDSSINKQSVITSVLKQMNSTFSDVPVTERPGNGPRPVKLYNAS